MRWGGTTATGYDLEGQALRSLDELGRLTKYAYDTRGRQTSTTNPLNQTDTTGYDGSSNVVSTTDALSRTFASTYDALDRVVGTLDALGRRTTTVYDAVGNVLTQSDHLGRITSYTYDALNRQTKMTVAVGTSAQVTTETSYDEVGNAKTTKDGLGNVTTYLYDALNRQTTRIDPLSHRSTTTYDAVGNTIGVQDALGKWVTHSYDGLHRHIATTDPLLHTRTQIVDGLDRTAADLDALGNPVYHLFDALGRDAGTLDALGGYTKKEYDAAGSLVKLTDPVGNKWKYEVDALGREVVRIDPVGARYTTTYDAVGRVTTTTDRLGRVKQYNYDNGDRTTSVVWKNNAGATVNLLTYTYDDNDNLLTAADDDGTYTRSYDERNRLKTQNGLYGVGFTYVYDARDRTAVVDSLGGAITSVYDAVGRLTQRTHTGGASLRVNFGYNDRNERTSATRYSDTTGTTVVGTSSMTFDDAGRLTGLTHKNGSGATISYYANAFDAANRITSETRNGGTPVSYTYDSTSQLTDDSIKSYSYDLNGNRTMSGYTTGAANKITNDGVFTYSYDAEANLTKRSKGASAETWTFGYDHDNQMIWIEKRATDGGTLLLRVDYSYDVFSRRVKEDTTSTGTTTRKFAFGDNTVIHAELDNSNALVTRYVTGDVQGELWARVTGSSTFWVLQDRLSCVRDVADNTGAGVDHIDYDGFGNITSETDSTKTGDFTFTGLFFNRNTGLNHADYRVYAAAWGAWVQDDPILFGAGDANLRRYCSNSPTRLTDLNGREVRIPLSDLISMEQTRLLKDQNDEEKKILSSLTKLTGSGPVKDWLNGLAAETVTKVKNSPRALKLLILRALTNSSAFVRLWADGKSDQDKTTDVRVSKIDAALRGLDTDVLQLLGVKVTTDVKAITHIYNNKTEGKDGTVQGWGTAKLVITITVTGKLPQVGDLGQLKIELDPDRTFVVPPEPVGDFPLTAPGLEKEPSRRFVPIFTKDKKVRFINLGSPDKEWDCGTRVYYVPREKQINLPDEKTFPLGGK